MVKYVDIVCLSAAVMCMLNSSWAFPTSSDQQTTPTSETSVTSEANLNLNLGVLDTLEKTLSGLKHSTTYYLENTIKKNHVDAYTAAIIVQMPQAEPSPAISDNVINDAKHCQNLQTVFTTLDTVLSGYMTLVKAIPSYCFDTSALLARLQNVQDNVQRLLVQAPSETTPTTTSPRDIQYTIQKLTALAVQNDRMVKIVENLQQCASTH